MKTKILCLLATALILNSTGLAQTAEEPLNAPRKPSPPGAPKPPRAADGPAAAASPEAVDMQRVKAQIDRVAADAQVKAAQSALDRVWAISGGGGGGFSAMKPRQAMIIPNAQGQPADAPGLQEDMAVMARILDKAASPEQRRNNTINISIFPGGRTAHQDMYLGGYGALFFLNVNYPLAPAKTEAETETPENPPSEWDQTKRELFEPPSSDFGNYFGGAAGYGPAGHAEEFSPERVEELKNHMVSALTNAAHIRSLKGDEFVTVVITGSNPAPVRKAAAHSSRRGPARVQSSNAKAADENQLVFRARRRDIEACAAGRMTEAAFKQDVTIIAL